MKIIFIGTTEFGIPTLEKLKKDHELVLIVTQPDKPSGRKQELAPPPMKIWAEKNKVPFIQPAKIQDMKFRIQDSEPDLIIVAAYGQIIPKDILEIPKFKSINIHGSLLPKYRGASPIQAAILNLDPETGITLILMDEKMDHGPIIAMERTPISQDDDYVRLYTRLGLIAADLIMRTLPDWFEGKITPVEQQHEKATFTKLIRRADAKIDWSQPARVIHAQIRALNPEPGTWTTLNGRPVKILSATIVNDHKIELPGKIYPHEGQLAVKTIDNSLVIGQIQPEGKNPMPSKDFFNGLKGSTKLFI